MEKKKTEEELVAVRIHCDLWFRFAVWERNREQRVLVGPRAWSLRSRSDSVVGEDRRSSGLGSWILPLEFSGRSHFQETGIAEMAC